MFDHFHENVLAWWNLQTQNICDFADFYLLIWPQKLSDDFFDHGIFNYLQSIRNVWIVFHSGLSINKLILKNQIFEHMSKKKKKKIDKDKKNIKMNIQKLNLNVSWPKCNLGWKELPEQLSHLYFEVKSFYLILLWETMNILTYIKNIIFFNFKKNP